MLYYDYNTNRTVPTFGEAVEIFKSKIIDFLIQYIITINNNNDANIISFSNTYIKFQDNKYNYIIFDFYGNNLHIQFENRIYKLNVLFDIFMDIEEMMHDCKDRLYYIKNTDISSHANIEVPKYLANNPSIEFFKKAYKKFKIITVNMESINQNIKSYYEELDKYGFINVAVNMEVDNFDYLNRKFRFGFDKF